MVLIGEYLKKIRIKRKKTLFNVSEELKISISYLQAIENDQYSKTPGGAYTIGFIRTYADYLNLESPTFIYLDSSGGLITSTTHASTEIETRVGFDIGDSYNIIGSFEPGLDFNKGNIVVSLENIDYSPITISKDIVIENADEE